MKYKVGDKIRNLKSVYIEKGSEGWIIEVDTDDRIETYHVDFGSEKWWVSDSEIELVENTFETLEVGDIVVDDDGDEYAVLTPWIGKVIGLSTYSNAEFFGNFYTLEELEEDFTIKQSELSDTITLDGKTYKREDVIERLEELEPIEEE